jgi:hypothetical protein
MASVFIDIPGVGNVEAKNAATESTLREILKALQAGNKSAAKGGGGNTAVSGGAGGAGGAGGGTAAVGKNAANAAMKLGKFAGAAGFAVGAIVKLGEGVTDTIKQIANVGDSVESAASVFSGIPIVGTMFTAVAAASQKVTDAYLAGAKSGATFGGSINTFARSASEAGMTMEKFGALIARNGTGMLGFGSTVEEGAIRFAQVSKRLQASASDLYALGYSAEDVNQGLASYSALLKLQGRQNGKSNAEMAAGANRYLKEIDQLAKVTGEERSVKEAEMKKLATDAQFNAAMAGKDDKVAESFRKTVLGLPGPLQGFVKDWIATGTASSDENANIAAMMGTEVQGFLTNMRNKLNSGVELTAAEQDKLSEIIAKSSKSELERSGSALAVNRAFDGATNALVAGAGLQKDANQKATQSQTDAAKKTDGMNASMQEAQKKLAAISNEFQMFLANSGLLETMLSAFQGLVGFVRTVMMPIFSVFGAALKLVWGVLELTLLPTFKLLAWAVEMAWKPFRIMGEYIGKLLSPLMGLYSVLNDKIGAAFERVGNFLSDTFEDALYAVGDTIQDYVMPVFNLLGRIIGNTADFFSKHFMETFRSITDWFGNKFSAPFKAISDYFSEKFGPIIKWMGEKFQAVSEYVGNFIRKFNTFGDIVDSLKISFRSLMLQLKEMWYAIKDLIPGLSDATPEERAALEKEKENLAEDRSKLDNRLQKQADENLKIQQAQEAARDKERADRDSKRDKDRKERDNKLDDHKRGLDTKAAADAKAEAQKSLDGSETDLLIAEATQQKSGYIKTSEASKSGEATMRAIAAEVEQKKTGAAKNETTEEVKTTQTTNPSTTQDSPATLLASLNTKMDQLIKHAAVTQSNTYETYRATNGLSGNLYKSI